MASVWHWKHLPSTTARRGCAAAPCEAFGDAASCAGASDTNSAPSRGPAHSNHKGDLIQGLRPLDAGARDRVVRHCFVWRDIKGSYELPPAGRFAWAIAQNQAAIDPPGPDDMI